jgi:N-acyl-D-aspartate/D-glutamate deacylase
VKVTRAAEQRKEARLKAHEFRKLMINCLENRRPFSKDFATLVTLWHNRDLMMTAAETCRAINMSRPTYLKYANLSNDELLKILDTIGKPRKMEWN